MFPKHSVSPNQSESRFVSCLVAICQKSIRINPIHSASIRFNFRKVEQKGLKNEVDKVGHKFI